MNFEASTLLFTPHSAGITVFVLVFCLLSLYHRYMRLKSHAVEKLEKLRKSDSHFRALLISLKGLIAEIDASGTIIRIFPSRCALQDASLSDLTGRSLEQLLPPDDAANLLHQIGGCLRDKTIQNAEIFLEKSDQWLDCSLTPLSPATVLAIVDDVSAVKNDQRLLRHRMNHDALTNLPSRELLLDRLNHALERVQRKKEYNYYVLFVDLDRFRIINETLGHDMGDLVLKATGERLKQTLRRIDTVARFGRDEFIILLEEPDSAHDAFRIVERIKRDFNQPLRIRDHEIYLSASIGIVYLSDQYKTARQVLRDAEAAMYQAKADGGHYRVYQSGMHERAAHLLTLETALRNAIKRNEFMLHYQPIISLTDGRITGLEALIRWNHPTLGTVSPMEFISVAEETGLIVPIGKWVLREACTQVASLVERFCIEKPFTLAVNISPRQFTRSDLLGTIREILAESAMDPECLKLEITETVMLHDPDTACEVFEGLRRLGVRLAIDDFGTGYSAMNYLHKYPFDTLKIDRSFINRIDRNGDKHVKIVQAIVSLARHLDMNVVAEGIEDDDQLSMLRELNCPCGQGFLFSRPLDADRLKDYLEGARPPMLS